MKELVGDLTVYPIGYPSHVTVSALVCTNLGLLWYIVFSVMLHAEAFSDPFLCCEVSVECIMKYAQKSQNYS